MKFSFLSPTFIEREINGSMVKFHPVRVITVGKLRGFLKPLFRGISAINAAGSTDIAKESVETADKEGFRQIRTELKAVTPEIAKLRSELSIDPKRIYAVGHSSAATLALQLACVEPRIAGVVAFAPETDLEGLFGEEFTKAVGEVVPEFPKFVERRSPRRTLAKLRCPVFLFIAQDDSVVAPAGLKEFATSLQATNARVALETVEKGDHYDAMIEAGIARAIAWVKALPPAGKGE